MTSTHILLAALFCLVVVSRAGSPSSYTFSVSSFTSFSPDASPFTSLSPFTVSFSSASYYSFSDYVTELSSSSNIILPTLQFSLLLSTGILLFNC
mmetsp:Transcript_26400/g.56348  ORF Transcript_26400/g.56348 Transcript_26400/m.56348 type:complete len:95 (-) Transcript_26400:9-293(-)